MAAEEEALREFLEGEEDQGEGALQDSLVAEVRTEAAGEVLVLRLVDMLP